MKHSFDTDETNGTCARVDDGKVRTGCVYKCIRTVAGIHHPAKKSLTSLLLGITNHRKYRTMGVYGTKE